MAKNEIKLVEPCVELQKAYLNFMQEFISKGEDAYIHGSGVRMEGTFERFVQMLQDYTNGINLPKGWVPASTYWMVSEKLLVGTCNLRHRLTQQLEEEGGHIGYAIRPTERGKGYGTLILKLVLEKARELGLERVLITCDKDNLASARVIQKNGGKPASASISKQSGKMKQRYWIDL